jgi:hypothetical protein
MAFGEALERFLGTVSTDRVYDMARGSITASERERIVREGARLENYMAIDDEAAPELGDVIARCTELKANQPGSRYCRRLHPTGSEPDGGTSG